MSPHRTKQAWEVHQHCAQKEPQSSEVGAAHFGCALIGRFIQFSAFGKFKPLKSVLTLPNDPNYSK